jgi:NosR/NirI family nitrous oxide reductase transcriptional regulator
MPVLESLLRPLRRYARWLHTGWPAGRVEPLPAVGPEGRTNVPGLWIAGDLTGVPLLKFALDSGTRTMRAIAGALASRGGRAAERAGDGPDVVILGAGVAGMAAALEAGRLGLRTVLLEASEPFSTLVHFPRGKPIFTYPPAMRPAGGLQVRADVKEGLLDELRAQVAAAGVTVTTGRAERVARRDGRLEVRLEDGGLVRAPHVLVAIGRSGDFRRLDVPGESLPKVYNRLHDPADFAARDVLVVGGGDAALETAVALATSGARVTLAHRGDGFPRARPENVAALEAAAGTGLTVLRRTRVREIGERDVRLETAAATAAASGARTLPNDVVFTMIGREAPLAFLRRSGVRIAGEGSAFGGAAVAAFLVALALLYDWKSSGFLDAALWSRFAWPGDMPERLAALGAAWSAQVADRATWLGTLAVSMKGRSFTYTLLYTVLVGVFGWRRIRRRRTPYVTRQTLVLFAIQAVPLFLLPELLLPWLGYNGAFDHGAGRWLADHLFESYVPAADLAAHHWPAWGHPRAYWRAYGLILAWPLNVYNIFTAQPLWAWIALGALQTFVLIPLAVLRWGKGAYCGWVCSCGALAETLGDTQRSKMPHGPGWNRLNLVGQVLLAVAFALLALRVLAWAFPALGLGGVFDLLMEGRGGDGRLVNPLSWKWTVDVLLAGVLGVGFYFRASGRVWCRFACPLAAFMHVVARFSRFAIVPEKPKCISCNVCTSVCHQGIDVMAFANRGLPMQDPQCVRCSACVQSCPTGVLQFGRVTPEGRLIGVDEIRATARPGGS